ncbi:heme exporter protein CcmD [Candidatus Methylospira mobilis]|uniref:Heme exporter protein D n=1 Tax=Candidatus Methylospira mobilis TaxID=1808979 RepID=A0A5Q0BII0_9GAMM|nr:heme exporter protein CcmD [Candidatus Methylospira mobilis]QFY41636.1 heme exporter protein CcmD [Candidatus Methylospira mobilis]WNV05113.1 heme exporter protein CcmD [Candidatus Methylospira mobilis]
MTLEQFFDMGGYARYVWPSYGLALLVLGWNLLAALQKISQIKAQTRRHLARGPQR